jgi:hypothetical protein
MGIRSDRPSAFQVPLAAKDPGRPGIAMSHKTKQINDQNRSECKGYPFSLRPDGKHLPPPGIQRQNSCSGHLINYRPHLRKHERMRMMRQKARRLYLKVSFLYNFASFLVFA